MEQEEKDEILLVINSLKHFNKDYRESYDDFKRAKNDKIRKESRRLMDNASGMIDVWLKRNAKVLKIASGGDKAEDFDRIDYYNSNFSKANLEQEVKNIIEELEKLVADEPTRE